MRVTVTDDEGTVIESFTVDDRLADPVKGGRWQKVEFALRQAALMAQVGRNEWDADDEDDPLTVKAAAAVRPPRNRAEWEQRGRCASVSAGRICMGREGHDGNHWNGKTVWLDATMTPPKEG